MRFFTKLTVFTVFSLNLLFLHCSGPDFIKVNIQFGDTKIGDFDIPVTPATTLSQISLKVLNRYFASANKLVNSGEIRVLIASSVLYVYELGEPMHKPNGGTRVGKLKNYLNLRYLLHIR